MINNEIKEHWNKLNIKYNNSWKTLSSLKMSQREKEFIKYYLNQETPKKILDIGSGTGRILDDLTKYSSNNSEIYGIDFAKKMIDYCKERFIKNKKIKKLTVCDISKEKINIYENFDFITAIRVLQYSKNWREILKKIYLRLNNKGVLIFSLPNYNSINRFIKHTISCDKITANKLRVILPEIGFRVIEIRSMTKIPDFFYQCSFANNVLYTKLLIFSEKILESIFGKVFLGRVLFIAASKK